MSPKARANAARKTGQRALLDKIAEEANRKCNVASVKSWSAPPCDCPHVISYTMPDGRVVRTCGEHVAILNAIT
jgi:hypothetical protein